MKIRELLKNFFGDNEVQIKDDFNYDIHSFKNYEQAILHFGHYTVKNWHIEKYWEMIYFVKYIAYH